MCHLSLPRLMRNCLIIHLLHHFIFFIIVPDKLTGLPVLSASWIIIDMTSETSIGVNVKCVPWFDEANKSADIKEMKRILVWVSTKRLSSAFQISWGWSDSISRSIQPVTKPAWRRSEGRAFMQRIGKYHAVSQPVCVMAEPLPVHKENPVPHFFPSALWFILLPTTWLWALTIQQQMPGHKPNFTKGQAQIYFHYLIFSLFWLIFVMYGRGAAIFIIN